MIPFSAAGLKTVLLLGAHCDDVDIGCGATIQALLSQHPQLSVHWIVFASNPVRAQEASRCAAALLGQDLARHEITINAFRDGYFPAQFSEIKQYFEEIKARCRPDLIFTHYGRDAHQDHRIVSELTWNTFRNHTILEYEVPKFDGDLGAPNVYVPTSKEHLDRKIASLQNCFTSEAGKHWFTSDTFSGLMRLRGIECVSESGFAEAFYSRKLVLFDAGR